MRKGWTETSLGEIAEVIGGGTPSTAIAEYWDGDIVWLTPTEITSQHGKVVSDSIRKITDLGFKNSGAQMLPKDSVILTSRASVGYVALAGKDLCTNQGFQSLIPKQSVLAKYLMFWIQQNRTEFESRSAGSTFKEISKSNVKSIKLHLPPLPEQKRIVDLISSVDSYIDALEKQAKISRILRNSILETQLVEFRRLYGTVPLSSVCASGNHSIVDGPFGSNLQRRDYIDSGIPVLKLQNVKEGFILKKNLDYVSESKYLELKRHSFLLGDIVMTKLGDPLGVSSIVSDIDKGLIVADLVRIRPESIDKNFLCMQINSKVIKFHLNRQQKGSTRPRINLGMVRELPIVNPPVNEVLKCINLISKFDDYIEFVHGLLLKQRQLRSDLLSDLLSGNHEIPESYDKVMGAA